MQAASLETTMPIMINQTISMFVMMAVGYVLFKTKRMDNHGASQMANVALYVAGPSITLSAFATPFDREKLVLGAACMGLTIVFTLLGALIARIAYRDGNRISQLGVAASNLGFMGIPIVQAVLGDQYVFYISVCIAAQVLISFTYGVVLVTGDKSQVSPKRIIANPAIAAVGVGVVLFLCSFEFPTMGRAALTGLSNLNTGLAMLVLGSYLAQADFRSIMRDKSLYLTHFLRLVVVPLIVIAVLRPMPLPTPVKLVLLIAFSAPSATVTAIFPQIYGGDYRFGAGLVSSSTLLSLITMPIMLGLGVKLF